MTLTRKTPKRTRRPTRQVTRKRAHSVLNTRQVVQRIDGMIRELEVMRRQLVTTPKIIQPSGLTDELFGALGHGTWEEYDLNLDWARFTE